MKKAKLTNIYISFLNDSRRAPEEIFYAIEERIGSREIEDLIREANYCISERTLKERKHKARVVRFLLENWKLYK